MSENETKQPSASEVLTLLADWLSVCNTPCGSQDDALKLITKEIRLKAELDELDPAHLRTLAAILDKPEREQQIEIDLWSVDWATMPTETQDCPNWGKQSGGYGPCGKCPACWLNQNMDALKELKAMNDKQRAERIARDTIALVGTYGYAMNGPEEGELCELFPTGEYRVLSSGDQRGILDAPEGEVYFLSARLTAPTKAGEAQ